MTDWRQGDVDEWSASKRWLARRERGPARSAVVPASGCIWAQFSRLASTNAPGGNGLTPGVLARPGRQTILNDLFSWSFSDISESAWKSPDVHGG